MEHYSNASRHCVNSYLAVRYDGAGNVFIGGVDANRKIHTNRADCIGITQGWKKIISFKPEFGKKFFISAGTYYDSHNDCGGSAYWDAHKSNQHFFQKCSWQHISQVPLITVEVILQRERVSLQKEQNINQLLGQWYLVGTTLQEKRPCVVATIYKHSTRLFFKRSVNIGNQVYQIRDHPIEKMNAKEQVFMMNKNVYGYKMTRYTVGIRDYDFLTISNVHDKTEQYVFSAELYNNQEMIDVLKENYKNIPQFELKCYRD